MCNGSSDRSPEELREIVIRHLMEQPVFWGYTTRQEAEAALDRIIDGDDRIDDLADPYWTGHG